MNCNFCLKEFRFPCRARDHEKICKLNPLNLGKRGANQYTKAAALGLPKPIVRRHIWTEEEKALARERGKEINKKYWSNSENIEKHSRLMQSIVKNKPDSYSKNNVSGRVKIFSTIDFYGETRVKGKWELEVANWLNQHNVRWTNKINPYNYFWNNSWRLYFPDFLLIDNNVLIEVKGFETERDRAKWKAVSIPLFVVKKEEMKNLNKVLSRAAGWESDAVS